MTCETGRSCEAIITTPAGLQGDRRSGQTITIKRRSTDFVKNGVFLVGPPRVGDIGAGLRRAQAEGKVSR